MASQALSLSNPDLLAEYVPQSKLSGFFEKRLASPPDHMAMLIRNGEIVDTYKGAHFSVGGVLKSLKSLIVGSSHISILLADLKPFSLQTEFKAISADHVEITGQATFELQVNPDKPKNVMGLVNTCGYLTQDEVLARFKPHLTDRVLESAISQVNADEIRGDRGLQDHIQAEIMREVERVAGDLGLIVRATSFEWAINEVERERMQQSVQDREQDRLDRELEYLRRNMDRSKDSRTFQIHSDLDIAKVENASEEELEHLLLNREVRLTDAREQADRRQEIESISHQMEVVHKKRLDRFENELAESEHLVDMAERKVKLTKVQQEIKRLEITHDLDMRKLSKLTELELHKSSRLQELEDRRLVSMQQVEHLQSLQDLEQRGEDAEADRAKQRMELEAKVEIDKSNAANQARVDQMQAGAILTPEQILAVNAGFSTDVANILAEQAKASAGNSEEVMSTMQQLVEQSNEARVESAQQAREFFQMGMQGAQGVANGVGQAAKSGPIGTSGSDSCNDVECSKCGRKNESTYRFCIGCGNQLRS